MDKVERYARDSSPIMCFMQISSSFSSQPAVTCAHELYSSTPKKLKNVFDVNSPFFMVNNEQFKRGISFCC